MRAVAPAATSYVTRCTDAGWLLTAFVGAALQLSVPSRRTRFLYEPAPEWCAKPSQTFDVDAPATLRVIHNSPDALPVDVIVNDNFAAPLIEDLVFPSFTGYVEIPTGAYNVKVTEANNPGTVYINEDLTLASDEYSVYAVGFEANIAASLLVDDNRDVATEARVRIVHGSPSAGPVDIYVTEGGTGIGSATPAFSGVPFLAETGYVSLAAGAYDVTVTQAGMMTPAIGPATITVTAGGVYTAVARDAAGGGLPLGLILLDDFND